MNAKQLSTTPLATTVETHVGRLRAARLKRFPTLSELADRIGVSVNAIGMWERSGRLPKNRLIRREYLAAIGLTESQVAS